MTSNRLTCIAFLGGRHLLRYRPVLLDNKLDNSRHSQNRPKVQKARPVTFGNF